MVNIITTSDLQPIRDEISMIHNAIKALAKQAELASVYTNETLAKELKVSKRTLQDWRDSGKINFSKVGRRIFYRRQDVEKLLFESNNELFAERTKQRGRLKKW